MHSSTLRLRALTILLFGIVFWIVSMPIELAKYKSPQGLEYIHLYDVDGVLNVWGLGWFGFSRIQGVFQALSITLIHFDACLLLSIFCFGLCYYVLSRRHSVGDKARVAFADTAASAQQNSEVHLPVALCISASTLVFAGFVLGVHTVRMDYVDSYSSLGFAFCLMSLLATGSLAYGLLRVTASRRHAYFAAVTLCALPMAMIVGINDAILIKGEIEDAETAAWWDDLDKIAKLFSEYCFFNPDRIHPISGSEEVTCEGFMSFCQSKANSQPLPLNSDGDQFLDLQGGHLRYFVDLDHDYFIGRFFVSAGSVKVTSALEIGGMTQLWKPDEAARAKLPYAKPVDGKPGFIVSPYTPGAEWNAKDIPSQTVIADSRVNKAYLMP